MLQMHRYAVEVVGPERAMRTTCLPCRIEHEVINDQLAAAVQQLRQALPAVGSFEYVVLLDALPRQFAPLAAQLVAQPREFLLPREQPLARFEPFLV